MKWAFGVLSLANDGRERWRGACLQSCPLDSGTGGSLRWPGEPFGDGVPRIDVTRLELRQQQHLGRVAGKNQHGRQPVVRQRWSLAFYLLRPMPLGDGCAMGSQPSLEDGGVSSPTRRLADTAGGGAAAPPLSRRRTIGEQSSGRSRGGEWRTQGGTAKALPHCRSSTGDPPAGLGDAERRGHQR
ncbi:hypothetical protein NDU88_003202 [Pleurodeles waltl]|uniref:Uncharacterized protein n=1 Tax=Pleurodeles waltl TaxID=8319 RepID=A0AAV7MUY7_PLEWA|nr:hypothetical protein NDU88_003202 [Pleurodeles waltl]